MNHFAFATLLFGILAIAPTGCDQAERERTKARLAKANAELAKAKAQLAEANKTIAKLKADLKKAEEKAQIEIRLPKINKAKPLDDSKQLIINVTRDGKYRVAQKEFTAVQLLNLLRQTRQKYPQISVLIRADGRAEWRHPIRVIGMCNRAGITNYRIAAIVHE